VPTRTWYPGKNLVLKTHEEMLSEFGGHAGFERGIQLLDVVLKEVKRTKGIYGKAAVLLSRLVEVRIFCDGNHRTAYAITDIFLRMNGERIRVDDELKVIRFIKDIKSYNLIEIEAWLRDGKVPKRPGCRSS
jgi:death-on-curing protein